MYNKYDNFKSPYKNYTVYMVIMAIFMCIITYYNIRLGIIAFILYGALLIYSIKINRYKKDKWKQFIEDFSYKLNNANRNTLLKFPLPMMILNEKGNIVWYNHSFSLMLDQKDVLESNINNIIKELNVKQILEGKKVDLKGIKIFDRYYDIYTNIVDNSSDKYEDKMILLYLCDITDMYNVIKDIDNNKEIVMLIEVDNLDEVIKSTDEDSRPMLIAEIEKNINSYAQNLSAVVKKYDSNKYILSVQDKYITKEMEKKFDILDTVRDINEGNKLTVTLSIGIGRGGDNPLENGKYATSAKELALGRGGDQAVVKTGDKLAFYGGKTKEVEKRTKVRARVIAHALLELINESDKVLIMGHVNADIDCLGAAVGLFSMVNLLKKPCNIILDENNNSIKLIMKKLRNTEKYKNVFIKSQDAFDKITSDTLLIIVDVHNRGYVDNINVVERCKNLVVIDHHRKSTDYIKGALLSYIEPYASSTSELVTEMIQYMMERPKLDVIEAEALLAGICVDTKNFYFKTGVRTFEAASFLRKLGADTIDVKKLFSDDLHTYLKKYEILKSAEVRDGIAIAICPKDIQDAILAAQTADEFLNITGIHSSFVLVGINNEIFISGRSLGDVNVQVILESLGGGGHMTMAGARLKDISMNDAVNKLKDSIQKYLMEGENK